MSAFMRFCLRAGAVDVTAHCHRDVLTTQAFERRCKTGKLHFLYLHFTRVN